MDAQPISNPERLMMASEMDLDEADEEAMAIVADELGLKIGNKVCQYIIIVQRGCRQL